MKRALTTNFRSIAVSCAIVLFLGAALSGFWVFRGIVLACSNGSNPIPPAPQNALVLDIIGVGQVDINNNNSHTTVTYTQVKRYITYTTPRTLVLTAQNSPADPKWTFSRWRETGSTTAAISVPVSGTVYRTAVFVASIPDNEPDEWFTLRTSVSPAEAVTAGCVLSPSGDTKQPANSQVALSPKGAGGWTFSAWGGANAADIDSSVTPSIITMNADKSVSAVFVQKYLLTTKTEGKGSISATPSGPRYTPGTSVTLSATPSTGWTFTGWGGDVSGQSNPLSPALVMNSDKTATATFTKAATKSLSVITPENCKIRVTASPNGTNSGNNPLLPGTDVLQFTSNSTVTLDLQVSGLSRALGYRFVRWDGDVPAGHSTDNPITISVDSDKAVEAVVEKTYSLVVVPVGTGTVSVTAPPGTDAGDGRYVEGSQITLTANPDTNFVRWRGSLSGSSAVQTLTMNSNKWVYARFLSGPGASPYVNINSADVTQDTIGVTLAPAGLSGTLTLTLMGPPPTAGAPPAVCQVLTGTRGSGTTNESFNVHNLATGEYTKLRAQWTVNGTSYYDDRDWHIGVLGIFNQTYYNCPDESGPNCQSLGTTTSVCSADASCNYTVGGYTLATMFFNELYENGTGFSSAGVYLHRADYCLKPEHHFPAPAPCMVGTNSYALTVVPGVIGSSGVYLEVDNSLAVDLTYPTLVGRVSKGDKLYIEGKGMRTVVDDCPGCDDEKIDNYAGPADCNVTPGTDMQRMVIVVR